MIDFNRESMKEVADAESFAVATEMFQSAFDGVKGLVQARYEVNDEDAAAVVIKSMLCVATMRCERLYGFPPDEEQYMKTVKAVLRVVSRAPLERKTLWARVLRLFTRG